MEIKKEYKRPHGTTIQIVVTMGLDFEFETSVYTRQKHKKKWVMVPKPVNNSMAMITRYIDVKELNLMYKELLEKVEKPYKIKYAAKPVQAH